MKKLIFVLMIAVSSGFGYWDTDMDGVEDSKDRCPNTLLSDLVDEQGCTIQSVKPMAHYDMTVGIGYSQINYAAQEKANTSTTSLQANYYSGRDVFYFSSSYFRSTSAGVTQTGFNDTILGYSTKSAEKNNLTLSGGVAMILPTYESGYKNEATDFSGSLGIRYKLSDDVALFGGYSYTLVNDKNIKDVVSYHNTQSFYGGASYIVNNATSIGASYQQSESIYTDTEVMKTIAINGFYQLDSHWFTLVDYRYGLSESVSDHDVSLRLGYYF